MFLHLSDLHFRQPGTPLAQREEALRRLLLDDIPATVARLDGPVDSVLLTGDLARAGQSAEYRAARAWLDTLCQRLEIHNTKTLTVPGNHDVDWTRLNAGRLAINADLRASPAHLLDEKIDNLLEDPELVLNPLLHYQEFAAGCACDLAQCLAWQLPPLDLGRGYRLIIRGANSVINSDKGDGAGTMAVQLNQLLASNEPGIVRMLLIHHSPHFWRRQRPTPERCGQHIVLYGHTHIPSHTIDDLGRLTITAGAVHPEESEDFAVPGYNVIEIGVEETDTEAFAVVRVLHREFSKEDRSFFDGPPIEARIPILLSGPTQSGEGRSIDPVESHTEEATQAVRGMEKDGDSRAEESPPLTAADGSPDPSRAVRVAYERLGSGQRRRLLDRVGIPRAEVSGLPPHVQIAEVARRVLAQSSVEDFVAAAAEIGAE